MQLFFKNKVQNHSVLKNQILESINNFDKYSVRSNGEDIFNCDFHIKENFKNKKYVDIVFPAIDEHNEKLKKILGFSAVDVTTVWFQQYAKNGFHAWHTHGKCMFSNIYYVNLASQNSQTTFRHLGQTFSIDVEEGEILTFPSFFQHCSKPNNSDEIKTVIAFNSDFVNCNWG